MNRRQVMPAGHDRGRARSAGRAGPPRHEVVKLSAGREPPEEHPGRESLPRRWRLSVLFASPLLGLFLAEAVVRALDLRPAPWPTREGSLFRDSEVPELGFENDPGAVKTLILHGDEARRIPMRVNEQGFRGPLIPRERTAGRARVACVGDSHTFGEGVLEDETWPAQLARSLSGGGGPPPEVINAGVCAYDTLQEVLWMERQVLPYRPDLVLLQYYVNDTAARGMPIAAPSDWLLTLSSPHRRDWLARLREVSRAADFVLDRVYHRRGLALYSDLRTQLYEPDHPGWLRVQDALRRARHGLARHGIEFGVVLYPFLVRRGGRFTSQRAFELVSAFCAAEDIPCLDTSPAFEGFAGDELRVSLHDYHGNRLANELFASCVADWVRARGWLE